MPPEPDKRTLVLEAALTLFPRYGYKRTSVDDLAREAGIAKGTVYLYFENKRAIFRQASSFVVDGFLSRARAAAELPGPVEKRLERVLDAKFVVIYPLVTGSSHADEIMAHKNRLSGDIFQEGDNRFQDVLQDVIEQAVDSGELSLARLGFSPRQAAAFIFRGAEACSLAEDSGDPPSLADYQARLHDLVRVVVAAFAVDPEPA